MSVDDRSDTSGGFTAQAGPSFADTGPGAAAAVPPPLRTALRGMEI